MAAKNSKRRKQEEEPEGAVHASDHAGFRTPSSSSLFPLPFAFFEFFAAILTLPHLARGYPGRYLAFGSLGGLSRAR